MAPPGNPGEQIKGVKEPILPSAGWAGLRNSPAVWQQPGRDMLFCLNPPRSLPFPHWPDGATLPAAAAADVSLACAGSSRTHLPGRRHIAALRGLSGPGEVAAKSQARTALGLPRDSEEGTREGGAGSLSPDPSLHQRRLEEAPGPSLAEPAASLFSPQ